MPIGIGIAARTKINANIGKSAVSSDSQCEVEKLCLAVRYGADTVMDLSTGPQIDAVRERIIEAATVPVGTVPIYQVAEQTRRHCRHAAGGFSGRGGAAGPAGSRLHDDPLRAAPRALAALTERRLTGIVSRGGSLVAKWMLAHGEENPVLHALRRPLRHHAPVRRDLELGRRVAAGLDRRRQRRGPVRRVEGDGRTGPPRPAGAAAR